MRLRRRFTQRLPVWLAFLAIGLAALAPTVSQCVLARQATVAAAVAGHNTMAEMSADCPGHMVMPGPAASSDRTAHHGQGGALMEACGYCHLMAHPPVLASVPSLPMRAPVARVDLHPPTVPTGGREAPWLFDAAPRGPPRLT